MGFGKKLREIRHMTGKSLRDVEYIAVEIDDQIIYITSKKEKCRQS